MSLDSYQSVFDVASPTLRGGPSGGAGITNDYIFIKNDQVEMVGQQELVDFRMVGDSSKPVSKHFGLYASFRIL